MNTSKTFLVGTKTVKMISANIKIGFFHSIRNQEFHDYEIRFIHGILFLTKYCFVIFGPNI